ncbi:hypothetical protein SDJN03_04061, partial [Cucurbita argyrosperma subsp. sororia]
MSARNSRRDATERVLPPEEQQAKINEVKKLMGPETSFGGKIPGVFNYEDYSQRRMEACGNKERYMRLAVKMVFRLNKFAVVSMRTCYRSVRNYPFLSGLLCLLILLYRSSPFLFSLLLSASPVLICTAVLLGTLLSFGQPNIPEFETEEKVSRDVASLRYGILDNATVVAKEDDGFTVESFEGNGVGNSYVERYSEEERKTSKLDEHAGFVGFAPVIDEQNHEIEFEKGSVEVFERGGVEEFEKGEGEKTITEREFHSSELEERGEIYERDLDVKSSATDGENVIENQLLAAQSMRNEVFEVEDPNISIELVHKGDNLNSSLSDKDDHDENDYDSLGSDSDRAESSSPDASMADIMPLLDELHPLLNSEAPQPAHMSNEESDASSEQSCKSNGECVMSDDEAKVQGEERGVAEDEDDEDDEDDEGMQEEKEDESKSAIKWTEDDQKNLMDLGSLELERNQRLESLIARRRARNNMRMLAGKNLIDLDGFDLPSNVPPISTTRHNPFDPSYDSYDNMGLPPIPGSAPSILLPRRNPFDLPYDPNEEKPDLKSDDFEQEFFPPQQKDIFRRHESFSVGPSNFAISKLEQQNIRWKPYFMPEKIAAEGTSYSPLERQFSEVDESKLSCVSDTESMTSIPDQDDKKPDESQSFLETATGSYFDSSASGIEHENEPWEFIGSEDCVQENRDVHHEVIEITLGSTESHLESQSRPTEIGAADTPVEINASEIHSKNVLVETNFSSNSSLCSLSEEVNETPFEFKTDEGKLSSLQAEESGIDTTSITMLTAVEEDANFKNASEVLADNQHKEPVYDSSPKAKGKESEVHSEIEQDVTSSLKDMHDDSSELHKVDKNEQESREVSEFIVHEVTKVESPKHDTNYDAQNLAVAPELLVEHVSIDSGLSFSDIASVERVIVGDVMEEKDQWTSHEEGSIDGIHKVEDENLDSSPSSDQISSRSLIFTEPENQLSSAVIHVSSDIGSPSNPKHVEMHETLNNEESPEVEQTKICRSSSSDSSSVEEVILQTDVIFHTEQSTTSISHHGSEIPARDVNDPVETIDSVATSYDNLTTTNVTIPGSQEQKNTPVVDEQVSLISLPSTFPSELDQVEERAMNVKEFVRSEQDIIESSSVEPHTESEALQDLDIKIDSSDSSTPNVALENISPVTELEQSWSDKPMVDDLSNCEDTEEPGVLLTDSAAEVISENITPEVHEDISTALSSVDSDSSSSSSDHDFRSLNTGRDPKDDIVDEVVFEDREEFSRHLDYLAETFGPRFSEKMTREEVYEITDIDEGLLLELDEVGDFSVKEVGEPVLEEKVLSEEAQAERFELGSNSNPTEAKSDIPILEARSLDDINLAFRQLHEGVDVEDVILPSAIESLINELNPEASSDLEVVEARSLGDIHVALTQVSKDNIGESSSSSNNLEAKSDIPMLEAKSLDDINLAFRQLHEGVDVEDIILPSAIESQINELNPEASSDLEVVEARSLGDIHVALTQVSKDNIGESSSSSNNLEAKSDIPMLEAKSLDDINLAFRQLHEGVDVEDVILPSAIESQIDELNPESSSDLEVVEASSLGDIHVALTQVSKYNIGESSSSSNNLEAKSNIPMLEARSLDDINLAFRQLHEGVDVEDVVLPSAIESQINELNPEESLDLEDVEARSLEDIHVALTQVSKNNIDESSSSSNNLEAKSDIPILEARSLDDINLAFRQLHEGVDVEDVILPSAIESQINEVNPEASSDLEDVEARSLEDIHVALTQVSKKNIDESSSSSNNLEAKSDIPILEARSLDDINLAFRQLHEGVDVEDVILPSAIESQINELNPEASSDLEDVEARSLEDIHVALTQVSKNNIDESSSSSNNLEAKSDIPILEARSLDDINLAFRQLHEGVDVEDVILPSAIESQINELNPEASSDLEVVEARSVGDIHVALMQLSENSIVESGSTSNPTETKSDIPILEARSLDDINLAFRQLHEGVDLEDVILPSAVENQIKEESKAETSSDLEVVEAKSLGDIHVALMLQASEKNLNELPTSSVSNDPSKGGLEPYGVDSNIETVPSNTTNVDKPADIVDEKSLNPKVSASRTKDKKAKSGKSESGSSSSSSSSSSDSD